MSSGERVSVDGENSSLGFGYSRDFDIPSFICSRHEGSDDVEGDGDSLGLDPRVTTHPTVW